MSHQNNTGSFQIEEATISELHEAIKTGKTNCVEIVQSYINRSKAYNGVSSMLVTEDGATISDPVGVVRAGEAIRFQLGLFLLLMSCPILRNIKVYR